MAKRAFMRRRVATACHQTAMDANGRRPRSGATSPAAPQGTASPPMPRSSAQARRRNQRPNTLLHFGEAYLSFKYDLLRPRAGGGGTLRCARRELHHFPGTLVQLVDVHAAMIPSRCEASKMVAQTRAGAGTRGAHTRREPVVARQRDAVGKAPFFPTSAWRGLQEGKPMSSTTRASAPGPWLAAY